MTPDFYLCDVCGERVPKEHRMYFATGREMDAAGSMETVGRNVDLCGTHLVGLIRWLIRLQDNGATRQDHDKGRDAVNGVEMMIRQARK